MKTTRIRNKIKELLRESPKSTTEILEFINVNSRHGTTSQQLGNVLSKDKDIFKVGMVQRAGVRYGCYKVCQWGLRKNYTEDEIQRMRDANESLLVDQEIRRNYPDCPS